MKFLLKEDFVPAHVNKFYFWIAPALSMMPALVTLAAIPFGSTFLGFPMVVANINVGILFMFAISSVSVYGIVLAGWSSNSKYPFLGGIRSTSQMISYELGMGLSAVPVILVAGSTSLPKIVEYQIQNGWMLLPYSNGHFGWTKTLLWIPLIIAFVTFTISMFAETNRLPFDLPESETELRLSAWLSHRIFACDEVRPLLPRRIHRDDRRQLAHRRPLPWRLSYSGHPEWSRPGRTSADSLAPCTTIGPRFWVWGIVNITTFFAKVAVLLFVFIWIRWTLPRFRYDQLMKLGWLYIFEIALVNIFLTAGILAFTH